MTSIVLLKENDFQSVAENIFVGITNPHTRRAYEKGITDFMAWWVQRGEPSLSKNLVDQYKRELVDLGVGPSSVNRRLSVVKALAREAFQNGLLNSGVFAGIEAVAGVRTSSKSVGNWLTKDEAQELLDAPPDDTLKGIRDRAILSVLVGAGLRRAELVNLKWADHQTRDGRHVLVVRMGKGSKSRIVPIAKFTTNALIAWRVANPSLETDEKIFLPLDKSGNITGNSLSVDAVYNLVREYAALCEFGDLRPHDLRRTFAKLARQGGSHLEQIQYSLGHASISTTMQYIGEDINFVNAPCDALGL